MKTITHNSCIETEIICSPDNKNTYCITKRLKGIEGETGIIVMLFPTRNADNMNADDSTLNHLVAHLDDFGFNEVKIINLFSRVVNSRISARGLEVDSDNMKFIEDIILADKDLNNQKFIVAWGNSMETSKAVNESKKKIIEMYLDKEDISDEAYLLLLFLFFTGARRGEAAAMRFDRIDFENSKIVIAENKIVVDRQEYIKSPKTAAGRREIYIPKILLDELLKAKHNYDILKFKMGADYVDSGCVFHKEDGASYSPMGLSNIYWRFFKRHPELKRLKMHACRHTYCSLLLSNNVDVKTVQVSMGHKHLNTTMLTYAHAYESRKQAAANTLNNIFNSDNIGA